ncbi:hypothetical protein SAXI111661_07420 [Saccharomonospora xinjiangensis]|uniref:hypothetical protein n=1 Tax=Saccharomonospora xinjiangensis TaxID=75294 RepID=UPI00106F27ED|nr:hypothetical protein [Saccharomonospora xinjiangensis]QBQ59338.1 hypothetical protein EYD13_04825 [Saccharomonospora xinjiangensis]
MAGTVTRTDRTAVLEAAGFTILGEAEDASGVTPLAAIRATACASVVPCVRIELGDDDVERTERAWRETARDACLFDEHGACYLCITGPGASTLPWIHARLPERACFLPILRERTGTVEFVAVSPAGHPVVAVSEEEYEHWVVVTSAHDR